MDSVDDASRARTVEDLDVPTVGAVVRGQPGEGLPWRLVDAAGADVDFAALWLIDLHACDYSPATLRSYAYDLLSWLRFLAAVEVAWTQASRWEVRDWVRWHQTRRNDQRTRRADAAGSERPSAASVNAKTGKPYLADSYARSYVNHLLSSVSGFYEFALEADLGPLVNPVPKSRRELSRVDAHRDLMTPGPTVRRAPYRQKVVQKTPRALTDGLFDELFSRLATTRDKAIVATAVGSGLRASELLSMRRGGLHADTSTADVVPKGGRGVPVLVPLPAPAFVWIARYLAERPPGPPGEPVWMTVQGPPRPLTYWALRQVLERANRAIGTNVTMHDFRHTFCTRLAEDENMTMVDLQELMRHASITTTQVYLRPQLDDLVEKLQQHWNRPPAPPPTPAAGYDSADLRVLFGGGF